MNKQSQQITIFANYIKFNCKLRKYKQIRLITHLWFFCSSNKFHKKPSLLTFKMFCFLFQQTFTCSIQQQKHYTTVTLQMSFDIFLENCLCYLYSFFLIIFWNHIQLVEKYSKIHSVDFKLTKPFHANGLCSLPPEIIRKLLFSGVQKKTSDTNWFKNASILQKFSPNITEIFAIKDIDQSSGWIF